MKKVIKAPLVTEKNTLHNAAGVYVFEVDMNVSKPEIKASVEKRFKVKVDSVRTAVCRGHAKYSKYGLVKAPRWKKAFVKLVQGEKIALFEGV